MTEERYKEYVAQGGRTYSVYGFEVVSIRNALVFTTSKEVRLYVHMKDLTLHSDWPTKENQLSELETEYFISRFKSHNECYEHWENYTGHLHHQMNKRLHGEEAVGKPGARYFIVFAGGGTCGIKTEYGVYPKEVDIRKEMEKQRLGSFLYSISEVSMEDYNYFFSK